MAGGEGGVGGVGAASWMEPPVFGVAFKPERQFRFEGFIM